VIRGSSDNRIGGNTLTASSEYGTFLDEQQGRVFRDTVMTGHVIFGAETACACGTRHERRRPTTSCRTWSRTASRSTASRTAISDQIAGNRITGRGPNPVFVDGRALDKVSATQT